MRFNTAIVKCKGIIPRPAVFLALSLFGTCFVYVPRLRADQSQQEIISLLTTGQWTLRGVIRTFNQDGTYTSSSGAKGTWKITGNTLEITLGRMVMRFAMPLDPNGTSGVSQGGKEQTLARVSADNNPQYAHPFAFPFATITDELILSWQPQNALASSDFALHPSLSARLGRTG
jgi:hypothetical protein